MGQKSSTNAPENVDILDDHGDGPKSEASTENEEQREKFPVLKPAHREIVLECYENAYGDTAGRIFMRMGQQRDYFRAFMDGISPQQRELLIDNLRNYLNNVVDNIDDGEKVKNLSQSYGAFHVQMRSNGFKPDFFAITADAIATECVFMGGTATATAPAATFRAWTSLVQMMFSAVRDGYYAELRRQRRSPAFTCGDSIESMESAIGSVTNADQDDTSKTSDRKKSNSRQGSEGRFASSTPPRHESVTREGSGDPRRTPGEGDSVNGSHDSVDDARNPAVSLHRSDAFYVRKPTKIYQRSRSAIIDTAEMSQSNELIEYAIRRDRLKKTAAMEINSTDVSSTSGSNSPVVGRYQKNVSADSDYKKKHRIEEIIRRNEMRRFADTKSKSASASNLFDPNKIMDDFMNDRLKHN